MTQIIIISDLVRVYSLLLPGTKKASGLLKKPYSDYFFLFPSLQADLIFNRNYRGNQLKSPLPAITALILISRHSFITLAEINCSLPDHFPVQNFLTRVKTRDLGE